MKKSVLTLPLTLTALLTVWMLAAVAVHTLWPQMILPRLDITAVVLLCVLALVLGCYLSPRADYHYPYLAALGAVHFGLLPVAAAYVPWQSGVLLGAAGGLTLPLSAAVFAAARQRLPAAPLMPLGCAVCLYLAAQAFRGVLV